MIDKMRKFLLLGLPGAGKTTTMQAWVQFLNTQGICANFLPTDVLINQRIRPDDAIIQQYEESYGTILSEVFISSNLGCLNPLKTLTHFLDLEYIPS